jgi:hypothetical protein
MKLTAPSFLLAAAVALLGGCSKPNSTGTAEGDSNRPVTLRINWTVGRTYQLMMEVVATSEVTPPAQTQPVKRSTRISREFSLTALKALPNDGRELELTFLAEKLESEERGQRVVMFDSSRDAAEDGTNSVAAMLRKMIGAHVHYLVDGQGQVEKVEGFEALAADVAGTNDELQATFRGFFGEENLKRYAALADGLPAQPVKTGGAWTIDGHMTDPTLGVLSWNLQSTFKDWESRSNHNCVHFEYAGTLSSHSDKGPNAPRVENGKMSGETWFDPQLGMVVDSINDQDLRLKLLIGDQSVTPHITQRIHLTLKGVVEAPK